MEDNKVKAIGFQGGVASELMGSIAAMLVALPSAIAFGVVTYSAIGAQYAGIGAMTGMIGAAVLGLVAPFIGRTNGLITAPCAPSSAVLSAFILALVSGGAGYTPVDITAMLLLTALFSAVLQIIYGALGSGRLIKFIPYPVVTGYLSGVALLIALGQIPKVIGVAKGASLSSALLSPSLWRWESIVIGSVTIMVSACSGRITKKLPAAIIGLVGGVVAYFVLSIFTSGMLTLDNNPLVIGRISATGSFLDNATGRITSLLSIKTEWLKLVIVPSLTLSVLLSIDTLKTCVGLDALTKSRHNSSRELIGQGIANMVCAITGGMPGAGTMGPTLVNVTSGGKTFRSGVMEGILVVFAVVLLGGFIAWVPIAALAGILITIAWRMFDRSIFKLLHYPAGRFDFAVIASVIIVALTVDLIAASVVGVILAILLFIRDQVKGAVIRRKYYLNEMSSKTRRMPDERGALNSNGKLGIYCELQGNLFFGTTDQLYTQIEADLKTARFILFDMRRVQSIDYTAAHLFEQMHSRLSERNGRLLLSGMPTEFSKTDRDFEKYLVDMGIVKRQTGVKVCDTLDEGLEWMEERILQITGAKKTGKEELMGLKEFHLMRELEDENLRELLECMKEVSLNPGQRLFSQGDIGDELFLVRRGSVRIMLPLAGGKKHHLATISRGGFFGELSFLDRKVRSADVEAKTATDLYVLPRSLFNEKALLDAELGVKVFARIASAIAERLRQTDAELRLLEDR